MIPGWRAQVHYWSRQKSFLKQLAFTIVAAGFFGALLIIGLTPDTSRYVSTDPLEQKLRQDWQHLQHAKEPQPHQLVAWLQDITEDIHDVCDVLDIKTTTWADYQQDGRLAGHEVRPLLQRHAPDPATLQLWEDFIQASLDRDPLIAQKLGQKAAEASPLITAHQVHACLLMESAPSQALAALVHEATLFPSALVRIQAMHLAVRLQDAAVLRQIASQADWWMSMPASLRRVAAVEMGDYWLHWESVLEYRSLLAAPAGTLGMALLAAAVWYIILVLHGVQGRWRWCFPLLPMLAGIFSVWPVFMADAWQEIVLGMREDAPFPHDLWFWVAGVGMREELSKLLFASLFMPWLLLKRPPGGALMVGAFVGLGFALEENIGYYEKFQEGVALTRFFTANFFHAALTGICTHAFYDLLRSRFHSAERFLVTFLGVVVVHGVYDYPGSGDGTVAMGYISMILLAFTAWHFLDLVDQECPRSRQWVSPAAVFLLGTASLIAAIFLFTAVTTPDRQALVKAAADCVTVLPVGFIYWRRLGV